MPGLAFTCATSSFTDFAGTAMLEFVHYEFDPPKYDVEECRQRGMTFSAPIKVTCQLMIYEVGQGGERIVSGIKEQEDYFGEIPLMTETGTFIINGSERVIVSQLHRSPGAFFHSEDKALFIAQIIPYRGSWVEFEYDRHGTLAYFGAYDVHRARLMGRIAPSTGIAPFGELVAQVMTREPYASAKRVFWIVDNASSHRGQKAADRLTAAFPNAVMVHTPVHASWLNQVEIYFSVVQRKVVSPNDFNDLTEVGDRLRAFEDRYNAAAQPFQWKFTTSDLDDLLARLDRHTADHQEESSAAQAA